MKLLDWAASLFRPAGPAPADPSPIEAPAIAAPAEKVFGNDGSGPQVSPRAIAAELITLSRRTGFTWGQGSSTASRRQLVELYNRSLPFRRVAQTVAQKFAEVDWELFALRIKPSKRQGKQLRELAQGHVLGAYKALRRAPTRESRAHIWKRVDASDSVERTEIMNHPLLDIARGMFSGDPDITSLPILNGAPASAMWCTYDIVLGEAFELLVPNATGVPGGVLMIPPHWVQELPAAEDRFYRVQVPGGGHWRVPAELMLYHRQADALDPHGRGIGTGAMVAPELELDWQAAAALKTYFEGDMRPGVLLYGPGQARLGEQTERLYREFAEALRGPHNRWKGIHSISTMDGAQALPLDQDFSGARMSEFRGAEWDMIRGAIPGVPAEVLGELSNSNRATSYMAKSIFRDMAIMPRAEARRRVVMELVPRYRSPAPLVLEAYYPEPIDEEARQKYAELAPWAIPVAEHARRQGGEVIEGLGKIYAVPAGVAFRTEAEMLKPPDPLAAIPVPGGPADEFMDDEEPDDEPDEGDGDD